MGPFSRFIHALGYLTLCAFGLGCQAPVQLEPTWHTEDTAKSVFKVKVDDGSGSGWVWKNRDGGGSWLITAGHVCEGSTSFTLIDRVGTEWYAEKVMSGDTPDLCELWAPTVDAAASPALPLALAMPAYDEALISIGAPAGVYGGGVAPVYHNYYAGGEKFTGPVYFGISGGPILSKYGVVGVVVAGYMGADIGEMVTVNTLRDWLDPKSVLP